MCQGILVGSSWQSFNFSMVTVQWPRRGRGGKWRSALAALNHAPCRRRQDSALSRFNCQFSFGLRLPDRPHSPSVEEMVISLHPRATKDNLLVFGLGTLACRYSGRAGGRGMYSLKPDIVRRSHDPPLPAQSAPVIRFDMGMLKTERWRYLARSAVCALSFDGLVDLA